jgi:hypothetical protein
MAVACSGGMSPMLQLSPKAIRFILEAIIHYQTAQEARLHAADVPDEDLADLTNDYQYLEAIKSDLQRYHEELVSKGATSSAKQ